MTATGSDTPVAHACVVHLGLVGARDLFPGIGDSQRRTKFTDELTRQVSEKLAQLRRHPRLPLHDGHFFVGVMQPGNGGDGVLADACDTAGIALRAFLPQPRDEYLAAKDPRPPFDEDFSAAQREKVLQQLQRASVIQERVARIASSRAARFAETTSEILQHADIAVILQPKHRDGLGKPGRTNAFAEHAVRGGKPLYALTFWIDENQKLHVYDDLRYPRDMSWEAPRLPDVLPAPPLALEDMAQRVVAEGDALARVCNARCTQASESTVRTQLGIIGAAALFLLLTIAFRNSFAGLAAWLPVLIATLLLAVGGLVQRRLGSTSTAAVRQRWTELRLSIDIARSVRTFDPAASDADTGRPALPGQPHAFAFLRAAPLPDAARALAQTLAVAHLRRVRGARPPDWQQARDRYLRERLEPAAAAYRDKLYQVRRHVHIVIRQLRILVASAAIVLAAAVIASAATAHVAGTIAIVLALFGLLLPAMSLALRAHGCLLKHRMRASACADLYERLQRLSQRLERTSNEHEFLEVQTDAETQLLAATLDWYRWRRGEI